MQKTFSEVTVLLKRCPRCSGDLFRGWDGEFTCLQCGYATDWIDADQRLGVVARRWGEGKKAD